MVYLHTNPAAPIPFEDRQAAERFSIDNKLATNLCIVHEDGRVLSFKRKENTEFTVITKKENQ